MARQVSLEARLHGSGSIAAERREELGILRCHRCHIDTLPDERTGKCLFCGARLVGPPATVVRFPAHRVRCQCGHNEGMHDHLGRCFDCPCGLFTPAAVTS